MTGCDRQRWKGACLVKLPSSLEPRKFRVFTEKHLEDIPQIRELGERHRTSMKAIAAVLPFRVNNYVIEDLIDWTDIPNDPIYQLTFPQTGMLEPEHHGRMWGLVRSNAPAAEIRRAADEIRRTLNPHPAGQMEMNVPELNGKPLPGMQHKYRETVLFFPAAGQTCHTYCTYCFRWAQFVGTDELRFADHQAENLAEYLRLHREVRSVLITGGDPMVMKSKVLRRYIEPLLRPDLAHVESIRIGTKAPSYWPYRFVTDPDADDTLRLFEHVRSAGRHMALMAHYSHPRELETPIAQRALARIQDSGAVVRTQAPIIRHVNDSVGEWTRLWSLQTRLGAVPYYMFVARDTGPKSYFEVPLVRAHDIFSRAYRRMSGIVRTVRGPSMSDCAGKVLIDGVTRVRGKKVIVLKFLQARDPEWAGEIFFAEYDDQATWLDELKPAFDEDRFFFEDALDEMRGDAAVAAEA
jgi:L-lysine 2,3-aminomutase